VNSHPPKDLPPFPPPRYMGFQRFSFPPHRPWLLASAPQCARRPPGKSCTLIMFFFLIGVEGFRSCALPPSSHSFSPSYMSCIYLNRPPQAVSFLCLILFQPGQPPPNRAPTTPPALISNMIKSLSAKFIPLSSFMVLQVFDPQLSPTRSLTYSNSHAGNDQIFPSDFMK